jgi:hypothetical protein
MSRILPLAVLALTGLATEAGAAGQEPRAHFEAFARKHYKDPIIEGGEQQPGPLRGKVWFFSAFGARQPGGGPAHPRPLDRDGAHEVELEVTFRGRGQLRWRGHDETEPGRFRVTLGKGAFVVEPR